MSRRLTSWPLLVESRRALLARGFIPNRRAEPTRSTSRAVVRRIGTVPSGHRSPPSLHACGKSAAEEASSSSAAAAPLGTGLTAGSSCDRKDDDDVCTLQRDI